MSVETLQNWVDCFSEQAKKMYQRARAILAEIKPGFRFEKDKRLSGYNFPQTYSKTRTSGRIHLYQLFILREYFVFMVEPEDFLVWLIFVSRQQGYKKTKTTRFGIVNNHQSGNNSP